MTKNKEPKVIDLANEIFNLRGLGHLSDILFESNTNDLKKDSPIIVFDGKMNILHVSRMEAGYGKLYIICDDIDDTRAERH